MKVSWLTKPTLQKKVFVFEPGAAEGYHFCQDDVTRSETFVGLHL